jgi:NAD(P)H-quinone oxidoreductase subunit K
MNLIFSENDGKYLNKTSTKVIPSSNKEKITESPDISKNAEIINIEEN